MREERAREKEGWMGRGGIYENQNEWKYLNARGKRAALAAAAAAASKANEESDKIETMRGETVQTM